MLWLGVFCCGARAREARATYGAEKATQGARVRQHERSGYRRCEPRMAGAEQQQRLHIACCVGTCCGAACWAVQDN
eukprot:3686865-Prymnesium_polylepis.1